MGTTGTTVDANEIYATVRSTSADDVAMILDAAQRVVFVPGAMQETLDSGSATRALVDLVRGVSRQLQGFLRHPYPPGGGSPAPLPKAV